MARTLARLVVRCALAAGLLLVVLPTAEAATRLGSTGAEQVLAPEAAAEAALVQARFGDHGERGLAAKWRWFARIVVLVAVVGARTRSLRPPGIESPPHRGTLLGFSRAGRAPPAPLLRVV
jgi:hypothetical protein